MSTQEKDALKKILLTGTHLAPSSHGAACACCMPEEDEDAD